MFEGMDAHHPAEPHWYLPLIGVDPARQGEGIGSALLARATRICDAQDRPACLEATDPRNVRLYRRHGFRPTGSIPLGAGVELVPMVRPPRS